MALLHRIDRSCGLDAARDPETTLRYRVFVVSALVLGVLILVTTIVLSLLPTVPMAPSRYLAFGGGVLSVVTGLAVLRYRRLKLAALVHVAGIFLAGLLIAIQTGGVLSHVMPMFILLPFFLGFFLGVSWAARGFLVATVTIVGLGLVQLSAPSLIGDPYPTAAAIPIAIGILCMGTISTALALAAAEYAARDLTRQLVEAREQAEAGNEAMSQFLARMSHEVRTPLNGVLGMAQSLQVSDPREDQRQKLDVILESGTVLMGVLNDVLDLSKVKAGQIDIRPVEEDLGRVLRGLHQLWLPKAELKDLVLNLKIPDDFPKHLNFDPLRVRQCVSNLVSNAIKFTDRGRVEILASAREIDGGAMTISIAVRDTGIGVPEEVRGRLFDPFVQIDDVVHRRSGGSGLGLSITRKLSRLMGGDVTLEPNKGRGTTFELTFKATAPHSALEPEPQEADPQDTLALVPRGASLLPLPNDLRVLLVEDNPVNRRVARQFLEPVGARITEAVDGLAALTQLARQPFDVVLLDVHMPVMDGIETIRQIRASGEPWAEIPVLAMTADAMIGDRERYLDEGMDGYIPKPVDARALMEALAGVTGRELARMTTGLSSPLSPSSAV